ncbi:MAG: hypothetical protein R2706_03500 [Acidimicrobiales bacterium]
MFSYQICDTSGLCSSATVTVEVLAEQSCTISGTNGDDVLVSTLAPDVICGVTAVPM